MVRTNARLLALSALLFALATTANAATDTWKIDTAHSNVSFTVRHNVISKLSGRFSQFDGTLVLDPEKLTATRIDVTIDANSINTDNEKRDGHLKSPDFFDTANNPTITFKSTGVKPKDKTTGVLLGNLTMHGVTKPVELRYTVLGYGDAFGGHRAGFEASGVINRKDFGINWNKALDNGGLVVSDEVAINLSIEAAQEKPAEAKVADSSKSIGR